MHVELSVKKIGRAIEIALMRFGERLGEKPAPGGWNVEGALSYEGAEAATSAPAAGSEEFARDTQAGMS